MSEKPRKQTRRAVSVSQGTYERLKAYGEENNRSLSSIVEEAIETFLPKSIDGDARLDRIREIVERKRA